MINPEIVDPRLLGQVGEMTRIGVQAVEPVARVALENIRNLLQTDPTANLIKTVIDMVSQNPEAGFMCIALVDAIIDTISDVKSGNVSGPQIVGNLAKRAVTEYTPMFAGVEAYRYCVGLPDPTIQWNTVGNILIGFEQTGIKYVGPVVTAIFTGIAAFPDVLKIPVAQKVGSIVTGLFEEAATRNSRNS